jgi:dGTPase
LSIDRRSIRLAPYATDPASSRGRLISEPPSPTRTPFQRDRDRIVHSTAFRRLTYKTQVFVYHEGDHYRTRLTHSLEVAQIARSVARTLRLDEDLTEAIALSHDLGHTPFGHAGERALSRAMSPFGGFDHNAQSLRIVTALERRYTAFDGLNLTWETLEGLVKHNGPLLPGTPPEDVVAYNATHDLDLAGFASVEAQIASLADDIAYNSHDIDDGYRAGLLSLADLAELPLVAKALEEAGADRGRIEESRLLNEITRRLISWMVEDVVLETTRRLQASAAGSANAVRHAASPMVAFSDGMAEEIAAFRRFLFERVYRHARVMRVMQDAEAVVGDLFEGYRRRPEELPEEWQGAAPLGDDRAYARHITDFIAGMTDRYALSEHRRLFDATPDLR